MSERASIGRHNPHVFGGQPGSEMRGEDRHTELADRGVGFRSLEENVDTTTAGAVSSPRLQRTIRVRAGLDSRASKTNPPPRLGRACVVGQLMAPLTGRMS